MHRASAECKINPDLVVDLWDLLRADFDWMVLQAQCSSSLMRGSSALAFVLVMLQSAVAGRFLLAMPCLELKTEA